MLIELSRLFYDFKAMLMPLRPRLITFLFFARSFFVNSVISISFILPTSSNFFLSIE